MSLQVILERIHAAGEAKVQEIERETRAKVGEILACAHMGADQIEEDARATAIAPSTRERARILHHARLEALRVVGSVRKELVDAALTQTRERLATFREDLRYAEVLQQLINEAVTELTASGREKKACLLADPRDRKILEDILTGMELELQVSYELNCWGGLIAKSEDGRIVAINTLETRLERATPFLQGYLAALFEEESSEVRQVEMIGS
jgi:vacuolar-type H+-ATPase subunit E/Vma4